MAMTRPTALGPLGDRPGGIPVPQAGFRGRPMQVDPTGPPPTPNARRPMPGVSGGVDPRLMAPPPPPQQIPPRPGAQLPDPYDVVGDPVGLVRQLGTGPELIAGLLSAGVTAIAFGDPRQDSNVQVIPITPEAGGPPGIPGGPMAGGPPMGPGPNLV